MKILFGTFFIMFFIMFFKLHAQSINTFQLTPYLHSNYGLGEIEIQETNPNYNIYKTPKRLNPPAAPILGIDFQFSKNILSYGGGATFGFSGGTSRIITHDGVIGVALSEMPSFYQLYGFLEINLVRTINKYLPDLLIQKEKKLKFESLLRFKSSLLIDQNNPFHEDGMQFSKDAHYFSWYNEELDVNKDVGFSIGGDFKVLWKYKDKPFLTTFIGFDKGFVRMSGIRYHYNTPEYGEQKVDTYSKGSQWYLGVGVPISLKRKNKSN